MQLLLSDKQCINGLRCRKNRFTKMGGYKIFVNIKNIDKKGKLYA